MADATSCGDFDVRIVDPDAPLDKGRVFSDPPTNIAATGDNPIFNASIGYALNDSGTFNPITIDDYDQVNINDKSLFKKSSNDVDSDTVTFDSNTNYFSKGIIFISGLSTITLPTNTWWFIEGVQ